MDSQNKIPFFRRRRIYINKDFQTRFVIILLSVVVFGSVISIGLTLFNTQGTLTSSFIDSKLVIQNTPLAILPSVIYTTLVTTFLVGVLVTIVTLLISHKIAGPMYRFEKDIERIAGGDLKNRIRIRKGDQFQELVITLNKMIDQLNREISSIKKDMAVLADRTDLTENCRQEIIRLDEKINSGFEL